MRPLMLLVAVLSFAAFLAFSCHATTAETQNGEPRISESESNCILKGGF